MFVNSDFSELLSLSNVGGVRYLVIGGYAVIQRSEPRFMKDLDLWNDTAPPNPTAVFKALRQFGAPLAGLTEADFADEGHFYQMGRPPVRVDLLMSVPGGQFGDAWDRRILVDYDGLPVLFIAREDLIAAKRAAGRPQDLVDAELLSQSRNADSR